MPKKKNRTNASPKQVHTMDTLAKTVRDISVSRKQELVENQELATLLCGLADYGGDLMRSILEESIMTEDMDIKKKDMLLVIQLMYMKLCSEILEHDGELKSGDTIPTSGYGSIEPIDNKKESVPIYL
jgi:hypothetical protein